MFEDYKARLGAVESKRAATEDTAVAIPPPLMETPI